MVAEPSTAGLVSYTSAMWGQDFSPAVTRRAEALRHTTHVGLKRGATHPEPLITTAAELRAGPPVLSLTA